MRGQGWSQRCRLPWQPFGPRGTSVCVSVRVLHWLWNAAFICAQWCSGSCSVNSVRRVFYSYTKWSWCPLQNLWCACICTRVDRDRQGREVTYVSCVSICRTRQARKDTGLSLQHIIVVQWASSWCMTSPTRSPSQPCKIGEYGSQDEKLHLGIFPSTEWSRHLHLLKRAISCPQWHRRGCAVQI